MSHDPQPDELRLWDYLDGRLDSDEQARFEEELRTNASLAEQLEQAKRLHLEVRAAFKIDPAKARMSSDPTEDAARWIEAASREVESNDVADHPLLRNRGVTLDKPVVWNRRLLTVALITAVTILLVVGLRVVRPSNESSPQPEGLAFISPESSTPDDANTAKPIESVSEALEREGIQSPSMVDSIAENKVVGEGSIDVAALDPTESVADEEMTGSALARSETPPAKLSSNEIGENVPNLNQDAMVAIDANRRAANKLQAIMVFEVRLTPMGRQTGAIRRALQAAEISSLEKRTVTTEVAEKTIEQVDVQIDESVRLLHLHASIKKFDEFFFALAERVGDVESIRLTLEGDPGFLAAVEQAGALEGNQLRSAKLSGSPDQMKLLMDKVDSMQMMPMKEDFKMSSGFGQNPGEQVKGSLLVIIR
ncbi:MAG: hypothetical protein AAF664_00240 [Planctomycetota bacterium]